MDSFLPNNYEVPQGPSNYMKFEIGANRFRALRSPIVGWEGWKDKKPIRRRMTESFIADEVDDVERIKHFWAMVVWNYKARRVQILEITQKGIQRTIKALIKDEEWGSPLEYDITVSREGEGMDTEYQVVPMPPKPLTKDITDAYNEMSINLDALYTGEDPFAKKGVELTDEEMEKI